jgi:competence protein ComEC
VKQTLQNIPFLRITIALAIGIVSGTYFHLNPTLIFVFTGVLLIGLFLINKNYRYSYNIYFGLGIQLFFVLLGILLTRQHNKKPFLFDKGNFIAVVLETPQEKQNSYKSILQIEAVSFSDSILATNETVIAYFAKSDSVGELKAGDIILFDKPPQSIENNNNPFEFNYKDYLGKKLIFRQVYLPAGNWLKTGQAKKSITIWAEKTREKLLQIYRNQPIDETEFEILSALTLGYKRELEPETKRIFSVSGASHVLAVSGLHVGVVFYLINLLFGFLRKIKKGRFLFMFISI